MAKAKKSKKKPKKTKKDMKTRLILSGEEMPEVDEKDEDEGGMFLEKEDVQIILNALNKYKPTEDEEYLHSVLLEEFEEILVVDYNEPYLDTTDV
jgi:hypothetical protein